MADDQHLIVAILVKYALRQSLDAAEEIVLDKWRARSEEHRRLPDQLRNARWVVKEHGKIEAPPTAEMWEEIRRYVDESDVDLEPVLPTRRRIGWIMAAAGIIGLTLVTAGIFWWTKRRPLDVAKHLFELPVVIPTGCNAVLELSDGRMIGLDTVVKGAVVMSKGGVTLTKANSNSYVYSGSNPAARQRISIALGGSPLRIQWPDGSTTWLDKGSSLESAVDLRSGEARIDGEAWFRVTHNPARPVSIAMVGGGMVRVLGTSFDVQARTGHRERVALFSGRLRVLKGGNSVMLKPGSQVEASDQLLKVTHAVDSDAQLAWLRPNGKGGWFDLHNADLLTMLPEMASWWRVTVVNPQRSGGLGITGTFRRGGSLATLIEQLNRIEYKHVQLTISQDTIYVEPLRPGG